MSTSQKNVTDNDVVDFCTKEELVSFQSLSPMHPPGCDITIRYTLGSRVGATPQDWIGIFPSDWRDTCHPLSFQWSPLHPPCKKRPRERVVVFPAECTETLKDTSQTYQVLYINKHNHVLGLSQPFLVTQEEEWCRDLDIDSLKTQDGHRDSEAERETESPVILSSDEEWEFANEASTKRHGSTTSDLSDIVVLSTSPSQEETKLVTQQDSNLLEEEGIYITRISQIVERPTEQNQQHDTQYDTPINDLSCRVANTKQVKVSEKPATCKELREKGQLAKKSKQKTDLSAPFACKDVSSDLKCVEQGVSLKQQVLKRCDDVSHGETLDRTRSASRSLPIFKRLRIVKVDDDSDDAADSITIASEKKNAKEQTSITNKIEVIVDDLGKDAEAENTIRQESPRVQTSIENCTQRGTKTDKSKRKKAKKRRQMQAQNPEPQASDTATSDISKPASVSTSKTLKTEQLNSISFHELSCGNLTNISSNPSSNPKQLVSIDAESRPEDKEELSRDASVDSEKSSNPGKDSFPDENKGLLRKKTRQAERMNKRVANCSLRDSEIDMTKLENDASNESKQLQNDSEAEASEDLKSFSCLGDEMKEIRKKYVQNGKTKGKKKKTVPLKPDHPGQCSIAILFNDDLPQKETQNTKNTKQKTKELICSELLEDTSERGFPALPSSHKQPANVSAIKTLSSVEDQDDATPSNQHQKGTTTHKHNQNDTTCTDLAQGKNHALSSMRFDIGNKDTSSGVDNNFKLQFDADDIENNDQCDLLVPEEDGLSSSQKLYIPPYLLHIMDAIPPPEKNPKEILAESRREALPLVMSKGPQAALKAKCKTKYSKRQELRRIKIKKKGLCLNSALLERIKQHLTNYAETQTITKVKLTKPEGSTTDIPVVESSVDSENLDATPAGDFSNTKTWDPVLFPSTSSTDTGYGTTYEGNVDVDSASDKMPTVMSYANVVKRSNEGQESQVKRQPRSEHSIVIDISSGEVQPTSATPEAAFGSRNTSHDCPSTKGHAEDNSQRHIRYSESTESADISKTSLVETQSCLDHWKKDQDTRNVARSTLYPRLEPSPPRELKVNTAACRKTENNLLLSWPVPTFTNIPSSFGSWFPQFSANDKNTVDPMSFSTPAEGGLHLRSVSRVYGNKTQSGQESPPKPPKKVVKDPQKQSVEPEHAAVSSESDRIAELNYALSESLAENRNLKQRTGLLEKRVEELESQLAGQQQLKEGNESQEEGEQQLQLLVTQGSNTNVISSTVKRNKVKALQQRRVTWMKWAGEVKDMLRSTAELVSLRSKVNSSTMDIAELETQVNTLKEALQVESKRALKAEFKWLKLKMKLKAAKIKLKSYEEGEKGEEPEEQSGTDKMAECEEACDYESYEPPLKKRRLQRDVSPVDTHGRSTTSISQSSDRDYKQNSINTEFIVESNTQLMETTEKQHEMGKETREAENFPHKSCQFTLNPSTTSIVSSYNIVPLSRQCPQCKIPKSNEDLSFQQSSWYQTLKPDAGRSHGGHGIFHCHQNSFSSLQTYPCRRTPSPPQIWQRSPHVRNGPQTQPVSSPQRRSSPPLLPLPYPNHSLTSFPQQFSDIHQQSSLLESPLSLSSPPFHKNSWRCTQSLLPLPPPTNYVTYPYGRSRLDFRGSSRSPPRQHRFPSTSPSSNNRDQHQTRPLSRQWETTSGTNPTISGSKMSANEGDQPQHSLFPYPSSNYPPFNHNIFQRFPRTDFITTTDNNNRQFHPSNQGCNLSSELQDQNWSKVYQGARNKDTLTQNKVKPIAEVLPQGVNWGTSIFHNSLKPKLCSLLNYATICPQRPANETPWTRDTQMYASAEESLGNNISHNDSSQVHHTMEIPMHGMTRMPEYPNSSASTFSENLPSAHFQSQFVEQSERDKLLMQQPIFNNQLQLQYDNHSRQFNIPQQNFHLPTHRDPVSVDYIFSQPPVSASASNVPFSQQAPPVTQSKRNPYRLFQTESSSSNQNTVKAGQSAFGRDLCTGNPSEDQQNVWMHRAETLGSTSWKQATNITGSNPLTGQHANQTAASFQNTKSTVELSAHGLVGAQDPSFNYRPANDGSANKRLIEAQEACHQREQG